MSKKLMTVAEKYGEDHEQICIGSYDFHAYCKYVNPDHEYQEFPHMNPPCETKTQAMNYLKSTGWVFHKDGTGTCPTCAQILKIGKFKK